MRPRCGLWAWGVWLYYYFFACAAWFSSFESCCQNYVYIHTYTIHFHQREKEKNMSLSCCWTVVILLSSTITFGTRCVEYRSVLFVDRHKPMTIAECHFKGFSNTNRCQLLTYSLKQPLLVTIYESANDLPGLRLFFFRCAVTHPCCAHEMWENQTNLKPKSHQLYVNLARRLGGGEGKEIARFVAEVVQLKSLIRSNPWIKWEEGKVFWAGTVESLHPAAGASEKRHVQEMSFNSWRVNE